MEEYIKSILIKSRINPISILEIGSRDANDAAKLASFFKIKPENVWVVEPNPKQQKFISSVHPNFNLIKNAIYNNENTLKFNAVNGDNLEGISSLLDRYDNIYSNINSEIITVSTITGEKLMNIINSEIDLCKIDVEGCTYEVLESFGTSLTKIKSFHLECEHELIWINQKLYKEVSNFLIDNNFVEIYFEYVNGINRQSDSVWINKNFLK